jgi:hypothetical protein
MCAPGSRKQGNSYYSANRHTPYARYNELFLRETGGITAIGGPFETTDIIGTVEWNVDAVVLTGADAIGIVQGRKIAPRAFKRRCPLPRCRYNLPTKSISP